MGKTVEFALDIGDSTSRLKNAPLKKSGTIKQSEDRRWQGRRYKELIPANNQFQERTIKFASQLFDQVGEHKKEV